MSPNVTPSSGGSRSQSPVLLPLAHPSSSGSRTLPRRVRSIVCAAQRTSCPSGPCCPAPKSFPADRQRLLALVVSIHPCTRLCIHAIAPSRASKAVDLTHVRRIPPASARLFGRVRQVRNPSRSDTSVDPCASLLSPGPAGVRTPCLPPLLSTISMGRHADLQQRSCAAFFSLSPPSSPFFSRSFFRTKSQPRTS